MNRVEYMKELEALLSDIPAEEREDAINYYNDYFDAGGEDNEEANIEALGSPEKLAQTIKLASGGAEVVDGEFTEIGYNDDFSEKDNQIDKYAKVTAANTGKGKDKKPKKEKSVGTIVLIVILAIFASPIILPLLIAFVATVFGLGIALIAVIFAIVVSIIAVGVSGIIVGVVGLISGIAALITNPFGALFVIGVALVAFAIGILFIIGCVALAKKAFPSLVRGIVSLCKMPFNWLNSKKKKEEA